MTGIQTCEVGATLVLPNVGYWSYKW